MKGGYMLAGRRISDGAYKPARLGVAEGAQGLPWIITKEGGIKNKTIRLICEGGKASPICKLDFFKKND